jgi:hypothetical protein
MSGPRSFARQAQNELFNPGVNVSSNRILQRALHWHEVLMGVMAILTPHFRAMPISCSVIGR